jgi:hypothetical protein
MRRFSLLLAALFLATGALNLVADGESYAPFLLRDALALASVAALLFAAQSADWQPTPSLRSVARLSAVGQLLWLTGLVSLLAGGVGLGLLAPGNAEKPLLLLLVWLLGGALLLIGSWWPGATYTYLPPPVRWLQTPKGQFVQVATQTGEPLPPSPPRPQRAATLGMLMVLLLALALRFWNIGALPAGCIGGECVDGLRLVQGQPLANTLSGTFAIQAWLAQTLFDWTGNSLLSLRLAAALLGSLGVLTFAGVTRQLVAPAYAPSALLLLALAPWHLEASRSSDPWIVAPLLISLVLWLALRSLSAVDRRWWSATGLATGLLFVEVPLLRPATALWLLLLLALLVWSTRAHWRAALVNAAAALAIACAVAAPVLSLTIDPPDLARAWTQAPWLMAALLRPEMIPDSIVAGSSLLTVFAAALAVTGAGTLLRFLLRPFALFWLAGLLLTGTAVASADLETTSPRSLLLPLLPFVLAASMVALDRLLAALVAAWHRTLSPTRLVVTASLGLLLLLAIPALRFTAALQDAQEAGSVQNVLSNALVRQLAHADRQQTFVIPAQVFAHPGLRLLAGDALAAGRVRALDFGTTLPYTAQPPGDVIYLVPSNQHQLLSQLRQIYPAAQVTDSPLDNAWSIDPETPLFSTVTVPQTAIVASQGLQLRLYQSGSDSPTLEVMVRETYFDWQRYPPLPPPFSGQLRASLAIPAAGIYLFSAEAGSAGLTLRIDDQLVLDTQLGVSQQAVALAQGLHALSIDYHSGAVPASLQLYWQPPAEERVPLPVTTLYSPQLPPAGLSGDYRAGNDPQGPLLTQRQDRLLGFDAGIEPPYNVFWQGKLGIARAGEYRIAALADGPSQIGVAGQLVVSGQPESNEPLTTFYQEGLIYLPRGWHDLTIRYQAQSDTPEFRLLWQPPGSSPGELDSTYLHPARGELSVADQPLPSPPPLLHPQLGTDDFALTRADKTWQPALRIPADTLPPLPLESLWTAGTGCGAGPNQLNAPHGLAFHPLTGQLYVADTGNRRVQVLETSGSFGPTFSDPAFAEPVDIAFVPDGSPLVLDAVAGPIYRLAADGAASLMDLQSTFYRPRGFASGNDGTIAVADTGGGRVVVLSPTGNEQAVLGGPDTLLARGQPVDTLFTPTGLWTISAEDGRLWNLSSDGSLTAIQPTQTLDGPHLAALPNGGLLASDPLRRTFTLFSAAGQPLQQFAYPEQLQLPTGLATWTAGSQLLIAASDTRSCSVSLWKTMVEWLP